VVTGAMPRLVLLLACFVLACRPDAREASAPSRGSVAHAAPAPPSIPPATDATTPGARRLERMLADRDRLRDELAARPEIRAWLVARFDGTNQPAGIDWDPAEPQSGQPAEHLQPQAPGAMFALRVSARYSGTDQLAGAVYEVFNMQGEAEMSAAWGDALAGRLSRNEFTTRMTQLELAAVVRLQQFAREHRLSARPDDVLLPRLLDAPTDYASFVAWTARLRHASGGHSSEEYWGRLYDARDREASAP
jgi:hypothetical protein